MFKTSMTSNDRSNTSTTAPANKSTALFKHNTYRNTPSTNKVSMAHSLHRAIFKKKQNDKSRNQQLPKKISLLNKYSSPTDNLLSPCSQKLNQFKSNIFKIRAAKPTKLKFTTKSSEDPEDQDIEDKFMDSF